VDADEGIVLTDREREVLAGLADSIGDPWLAGQLAGGEHPSARLRRPRQPKQPPTWVRRLSAAVSGWLSLLVVLAGAVLALATFSRSTAAASVGLVLMGVGSWRLAVDRGHGLVCRIRARWEQSAERRSRAAP
jgi:hypothetical protein